MKPAISIITVCRNALSQLQETAASIFCQSHKDIEWIIIDGNSEDGTRDYLEELDGEWIHWISEPDKGIYDAMNKGLRKAQGQRVLFLNAGDCLLDEGCLSKVIKVGTDSDICFGEVMICGNNGEVLGTRSEVTPHALPEELRKEQFQRGMVVSHQAFLPLREICPLFDDKRYQLSADLDWMLSILGQEPASINVGPLARVLRDGMTMKHWHRSQFERFLILGRHFGFAKTVINHFKLGWRRLKHGRKTRYWR